VSNATCALRNVIRMDGVTYQKQVIHRRLRVSPTFVIVMTTFIDMIGFGMIIPVLPFHPETVGAGALALGILIGSFSLMQFIFSPLLGRLSDKVGRRPVILISILSSVISFILFALANSFTLLLVSRLTAGMATEASVAQAYISDITTEHDRAKGMGKVGAANGAGFIVGPAIGGILSVHGLSTLGFAAAALTGINLFFAFFFLPESNGRFGQDIHTSSEGYWHRLGSALKKPLIGAVFLILFIITFAFSAVPVILPLLGIAFFGFGELEMSYFFMYVGLIQIVLQGILIGRLNARWGEENLLVFGSLLMAVGMFFMPLYPSLVVFFGSITLISSGIGILNTVLPSFLSKRTPSDEQGGMLGVAQSVGSIARIPGPLFGGFVSQFAGLNVAFFISAALVLICFFVGFRLFRDHRPKSKEMEVVGYPTIEL
jgi:DHA1 family tetracycline resistance protein-like MFS transporter